MSDASTGFFRFHPVVQPRESDHDPGPHADMSQCGDAPNFSVYDVRDMRLGAAENRRDLS